MKPSDEEWFELQFDPSEAKLKYGIQVPEMPDEATQISFTGMAGRPNIEQAFAFYRFARGASGIADHSAPRILDFGAGWGRIARLFLRDTPADHIVASDTMQFSVDWMKQISSGYRSTIHDLHFLRHAWQMRGLSNLRPWNFFLVANAIGRNASDHQPMSAVVAAPFERDPETWRSLDCRFAESGEHLPLARPDRSVGI
jgi:hypothetical protein